MSDPKTTVEIDPKHLAILKRVAQMASVNVTCWRFAVEAEASLGLQSRELVERTAARLEMHRAKADANRACLGLTAAVDAYHEFEDARRGGEESQ